MANVGGEACGRLDAYEGVLGSTEEERGKGVERARSLDCAEPFDDVEWVEESSLLSVRCGLFIKPVERDNKGSARDCHVVLPLIGKLKPICCPASRSNCYSAPESIRNGYGIN